MGRKRRNANTGSNSSQAGSIPGASAGAGRGAGKGGGSVTGPVAGRYVTSTGEVELRPDPYVADGWEVFVNGVPSSHISADPLRLEYEYMRWIAAGCEAVIDSRLDASRLRVTHLGGGACSLARYFATRYPSARQTVVEVDAELARLVREWFDLPRAPRLKIRVGDARAVADGFRPGSRDAVRRGLGPSGLYVANCGDHADLRLARSELRTMATVFARVGVIADPPMLKGRRYGNIVLLASDGGLPVTGDGVSAQLTKRLLAGAVPAQYRDDAWTRAFMAAGGRVRYDDPGVGLCHEL